MQIFYIRSGRFSDLQYINGYLFRHSNKVLVPLAILSIFSKFYSVIAPRIYQLPEIIKGCTNRNKYLILLNRDFGIGWNTLL